MTNYLIISPANNFKSIIRQITKSASFLMGFYKCFILYKILELM